MYYADFRYSKRLFEEALQSIREREPAMVVIAQRPPTRHMAAEEFLSIVPRGYEFDLSVAVESEDPSGVYVFRRKRAQSARRPETAQEQRAPTRSQSR